MKAQFKIYGMTCPSCENRVKAIIKATCQASDIEVDYIKQSAKFTVDKYNPKILQTALEKEGYTLNKTPLYRQIILGLILIGVIASANAFYMRVGQSGFKNSLGLLSAFLLGLTTSFHCIGMCGGFALSCAHQAQLKQRLRDTLTYNLARISVYGIIGGLLGMLGQSFTVSQSLRATLFLLIGCVMVVVALHQLGLTRGLIHLPKFTPVKSFEGKGPLLTGILNGFMPCGPLQTMQLFALTTGSALLGMSYMLAFGLGTIPLLMIFANLGSIIPKRHHALVFKTSGIIVLVMATMIIAQGLTGFGIALPQINDLTIDQFITSSTSEEPDLADSGQDVYAPIVNGYQELHVTVNYNYQVEAKLLKKDIPAKIIFNNVKITPCIDVATIPEYNLQLPLVGQHTEVTFTPTRSGDIVLACWMNMVRTTIPVE